MGKNRPPSLAFASGHTIITQWLPNDIFVTCLTSFNYGLGRCPILPRYPVMPLLPLHLRYREAHRYFYFALASTLGWPVLLRRDASSID